MADEEEQQLSIEMRMPTVIDDDMLSKAVYEQGPQEYAGKIAREEGINFGDVKKLRLDYRSKKMHVIRGGYRGGWGGASPTSIQ